ncbi:arginine ABC transporter permease ArtQ, partial [Coxiella burnetii]
QSEAGYTIGVPGWLICQRLVLHQARHHAWSGLGNLLLVLLKYSALVALIGLGDLMNKAQLAASTTREPFKFYVMAAFLFLLLTSVSQLVLKLFSVNKFQQS